MPALSPTMEEGTLSKWLVSEGDEVAAGDPIAEIETDKATMEVEAVDEGTMGKILVPAGTEGVKVNAVIALLLEEGEDESALEEADTEPPVAPPGGEGKDEGAGSEAKEERSEAEEEQKAEEKPETAAKPKETGKAAAAKANGGGAAPGELPGGPMPKAETAEGERIFASPLAKRMAQQAGLDLAALTGSGPRGRIVKADIETALEKGVGKKPAAAPAMAAARPGERRAPTEVEMSGVQKVIAERLTAADRDVPQFYLTVDIEIDRLLDARTLINDAAPADPESGKLAYKVSVNDMLIKAAAVALRRHPEVNAQWNDGKTILRLETVDIAVAVATERGLITPIVFDADLKGLAQIAADMKDLAGRAKAGRLKPEEYQGGGFSISNLGMFGMKQFTSIANPPGACILAVGAGERRPVVREGDRIEPATAMSVTLTCDHRVVDGALGATWLATFKALVEAPATMLA